MPLLKLLGAKWIVNALEYVADNPTMVVNGFPQAGILNALDGGDVVDSDGHDEDENAYSDEDEEEDEYNDYEKDHASSPLEED